jgi:methanogenic corrinoid protein MtbC1
MGAIELAGMILAGIAEGAKLVSRAIDLAREGNEEEALKLLDEALDRNAHAVAALQPALNEVKARIAKMLAAKFDNSETPTVIR